MEIPVHSSTSASEYDLRPLSKLRAELRTKGDKSVSTKTVIATTHETHDSKLLIRRVTTARLLPKSSVTVVQNKQQKQNKSKVQVGELNFINVYAAELYFQVGKIIVEANPCVIQQDLDHSYPIVYEE